MKNKKHRDGNLLIPHSLTSELLVTATPNNNEKPGDSVAADHEAVYDKLVLDVICQKRR